MERRPVPRQARADLCGKIEALTGPIHCIDFETSRLALLYHRGMRPYGPVTFQWSPTRPLR